MILEREGLGAFISLTQAMAVPTSGAQSMDAAMWRVGIRMMVTVVNAGEAGVEGGLRLESEKGVNQGGEGCFLGERRMED